VVEVVELVVELRIKQEAAVRVVLSMYLPLQRFLLVHML
jgi:hypothetical protein